MEIVVFGNRQPSGDFYKAHNHRFVDISNSFINEGYIELGMNELVSRDVGKDTECVIIDVDNITPGGNWRVPEYCLCLAMSIRLSVFEIKQGAFSPIILLTRRPLDDFLSKDNQYSNVVLTKGIELKNYKELEVALAKMKPLEVSEYKSNFLNKIKVPHKRNEGHHSIANQWGADVLSRVVLGENLRNESIARARQSMYFKYVRMQTLNVDELGRVIGDGNKETVSAKPQKINAKGKKVLLIDDEARNGWEDVLKKWLDGSDLDVICEQVPDYESLSQEAKKKIEKGEYDLIFLDLRMNGPKEEAHTKPKDFSGMRILKKIKELNKGTQVIMLTASNKVWNMRALLDAGADGYYVKESPEYAFPFSYSERNADELCKAVNRCLENGDLRRIWRDMEEIKKLISDTRDEDEEEYKEWVKKWINESRLGINVAFDLLTKSKQRGYMSFAFLQLFMPIENYVKKPGMFKEDNGLYYKEDEHGYEIVDALGDSYILKHSFEGFVFHQGRNHIDDKYMKDTYLRVSAILICKFGEDDANGLGWKKICEKRNDVAHRQDSRILIDDIKRVIEFMKFFFDDRNANWREV